MLLRFWWMAWCGELGVLTELLSFWGSWLAVVFMNSIADWRTRNCKATAISRKKNNTKGKGTLTTGGPDELHARITQTSDLRELVELINITLRSNLLVLGVAAMYRTSILLYRQNTDASSALIWIWIYSKHRLNPHTCKLKYFGHVKVNQPFAASVRFPSWRESETFFQTILLYPGLCAV